MVKKAIYVELQTADDLEEAKKYHKNITDSDAKKLKKLAAEVGKDITEYETNQRNLALLGSAR